MGLPVCAIAARAGGAYSLLKLLSTSVAHGLAPGGPSSSIFRMRSIFARSSWWKQQTHPLPELPGPVCEMIDMIEHYTGTKVLSIGNGPRGEEIIYIKKIGEDDSAAAEAVKSGTVQQIPLVSGTTTMSTITTVTTTVME